MKNYFNVTARSQLSIPMETAVDATIVVAVDGTITLYMDWQKDSH